MMDKDTGAVACADFYKAIGEPSRVRIISLLRERPRSLDDLCAAMSMGGGLLSHHLARLAAVGLVTVDDEDGEDLHYRLQPQLLSAMTRNLLSLVVAPAHPAPAHLRLVKPRRARAGRDQIPGRS
jgi:DNA-binding transcriptional ArsR family regulator